MPYPAKTDRTRILSAAMEQLACEGMRAVTIRGLAGSLGLAPNALYRYFVDRAALEGAMSAESTRRLHGSLLRAAEGKSPVEAVRSMACSYVQFAREHRFLYEAMMLPHKESTEAVEAGGALWSFVSGQVARLASPARAGVASVALWAFLHGMVGLEAAEAFGEQKPAQGFEFGLDAWLEAASAVGEAESS